MKVNDLFIIEIEILTLPITEQKSLIRYEFNACLLFYIEFFNLEFNFFFLSLYRIKLISGKNELGTQCTPEEHLGHSGCSLHLQTVLNYQNVCTSAKT